MATIIRILRFLMFGLCMVKLRVLSFGVSLDGYGAGSNQNLMHSQGSPIEFLPYPSLTYGVWSPPRSQMGLGVSSACN